MSIVVAAMVLLLAIIIGTFSLVMSIHIKGHNNEIVAAIIFNAAKIISIKQWVFIISMSFICAVLSFRLYASGMDVLDMFKYLAVLILLLAVLITDYNTYLIPNMFILIFFGIGIVLLLAEFVMYRKEAFPILIISIIGLTCCLVLFYILSRLTKDGISMGDVKLIAVLGWILGLAMTLFTVLLAMLLCMVAAIVLLVCKKKNKNDRVPFGPFIFFGYAIVLFLISV